MQDSARAQANVLTRLADDPRPLLLQLVTTLQFGAKDLTGMADRAEELAAEPDRQEASSPP